MSRILDSTDINFEQMLKKVERDIEEERLYKIRNDAKIRASVTSQNYDEFRDIVAAAHLTPLDKTDKSRKANIGWNKCTNANSSGGK